MGIIANMNSMMKLMIQVKIQTLAKNSEESDKQLMFVKVLKNVASSPKMSMPSPRPSSDNDVYQ